MSIINNNPLLQLVRTHISPDKTIETLPKVTIRDVILSITKIFQSSDIQILANNDNFKIKLSREDFQGLIDKNYGRYRDNAIESIRDYEEDYEKVMNEISMIEKGELDQLVIQEYKQSLPAQLTKPAQQQQQPSNTPAQQLKPQVQAPPSIIQQQSQTQTQAPPQLQPQQTKQVQAVHQTQASTQSQPPQATIPQTQSVPVPSTRLQATNAIEEPEKSNISVSKTDNNLPPNPVKSVDFAPVSNGEENEPVPATMENGNAEEETEEPEEVKAPTPEATTPPGDDNDVEMVDVKEEVETEKEGVKEEELIGETSDAKESTDGSEGDDRSVESARKRRSSTSKLEDKTPAKKRAKLSTSVPSSPAGPVHAPPNKKLQILSNPLIANITSYKYASTFLQPVSESNAPDYYSLIKEPRDLKTIKQMVKDGRIQNAAELEREILLMFANAIMYNKDGTDINNWSKEMQIETDKLLQLFKESYDTT
ncbi:hypothetical protein WICANDRAFT_70420 [Wickerhamomyces anomalus NRRL Y-366-8]|uniref:Bromo domain-containing protein n=1 Tax=Wickerhamomyces anomalus (strain ATCC 58044 / CBS 1984 / NCYC 433 / NRRL Y-366-8) TaxID=683960 RepID=A0A1E3P0R2_WICAA|nr:uncharacterized protein WICANDRAFT_70420 [Wickerhamomyces anomalus NRRL Y-366-8]ODQ58507.1 hypothetical protein WICANDRAFT_70420 [Wickerhamomyces anomalus NRRL Y-366-8]